MKKFKETIRQVGDSIETQIRMRLTPREYLEEKIPFLNDLELSKKEIDWIIQVQRDSEQGKKDKNYDGGKTRFDLIVLHLTLLRDLKKLGLEKVSKTTEDKLDEMIDYLVNFHRNRISKSGFEGFIDGTALRKLLPKENDVQSKLRALTEYLNWMHNHSYGLEQFWGMTPGWRTDDADRDYLTKLNNIGNDNFWQKLDE